MTLASIISSMGLAMVAGLYLFTVSQTGRIEARFPPRGQFIEVPGGRIHMVVRTPAAIPRATVVLLHGASANHADMTVPLGDQLVNAGFRVVAPDRPGHGWSDRLGGRDDASPAQQAALIRAALEKIGVHRAIVAGFSWSGALACNFALDHADFTLGLVLIAPVTHPWPGGVTWYYTPASLPIVGDIFTRLLTMPAGLLTFDAALAHVFAPTVPPADYTERTAAELVLRPAEFMANAEDVAGLKEFVTAQAPRLSSIRQPTAIVTGDRDGIVLTRIHSYGSARDISGAALTVVSGAGHSVHYADPGSVVAAIVDVASRSR